MGISGLLPFLKKASRTANIKEFAGCTVAIDSYCWLHKGAFSCAEKLALGEKTDQYVFYCMKYVNNLLANGLKPIMVFDGCHLPSKREVEKSRRERRETYRKKAAQYLREGNRSEARDCLTKCIDITPQMALELMNACRAKGVDCIVAPYEADAQLAYLNKRGIAQIIITEDSDLVLFGCEKVMFKMDFSGNGVLIEQDKLNTAMDIRADSFTFDKFRYMCILSGCDYLASLYGIGLGKACKLFKLTKQMDMNVVLKKMPTTLKMPSLTVTPDYVEGFFKANNTFLYQLVFDPIDRKLKPLNPYPDDINPQDLTYAGPQIPESKALQIAYGNIDINTGEQIAEFDPESFERPSTNWNDKSKPFSHGKQESLHLLSIWDKNYRPMPKFSKKGKVERVDNSSKEVKIKAPVLKTSISSKRLREEEGISEKDLVNLYQTEELEDQCRKMSSEKNVSIVKPTKKMKVENVLELIDDEQEPHNVLHVNNTCLNSPVKKSPAKRQSPLKFHGMENISPASQEKSAVRRNMFAVKKLKKERFDINSPKIKVEVKSRYFATSASPDIPKLEKKADFFSSLVESHSDQQSTLKVEEQANDSPKKDINDENPEDDICPVASDITEMKQGLQKNVSAKTKSSPFSSFSWKSNLDKFKLQKSESCSSLTSNDLVKKQFKPVHPAAGQLSLDSCHLSDQNNMLKRQNSESRNSQHSDMDDVPLPSQCSDLYSMDGDHGNSLSQSSLSESFSEQTASYDSGICGSVEDVIDLSAENEAQSDNLDKETTHTTPKLPRLPSMKTESNISSSKLLGSCRQSGLSKSNKKNKTTGVNAQKSISSFFNKFKNDKSTVAKLGTR